MTFLAQIKADALSMSASDGPFEPAILTTASGDEFDVLILRSGQNDRLPMDPGQADSCSFRVFKKIASDEITISPNDQITLSDESVWTVQPGISEHRATATWTCPVVSDRRVKA